MSWHKPANYNYWSNGPGTSGGTHAFTKSPNNWQSDNAIDFISNVGAKVFAVESGKITNVQFYNKHPSQYGWGFHLVGNSGNEYFYEHVDPKVVVTHTSTVSTKLGQWPPKKIYTDYIYVPHPGNYKNVNATTRRRGKVYKGINGMTVSKGAVIATVAQAPSGGMNHLHWAVKGNWNGRSYSPKPTQWGFHR